MSVNDKILIPVGEVLCTTIKAPHCVEFRGNYDTGICLFKPIIEAFKRVGLVPPPETLMDRADASVPRVEFMHNKHPLEHAGDVEYYGGLVRKGLKSFRGGDTYYGNESLKWADAFLQKVLRPDDMTFEQRLAIFDFFATEILKRVEEDYYHKTDYHYHFHSFTPPVGYIDRHYTLKEWIELGRARTEERVSDMVKAQTVMRNMAGYDWSPLSFFFGADLARFIQLKTATLNAELELSRNILKREYNDFIDTVQKASQMGSMRDNEIRLESLFLGKYKITICIRDTGGGARFSHAVRDNELVGLARDIGSAGKGLFSFIFGKK